MVFLSINANARERPFNQQFVNGDIHLSLTGTYWKVSCSKTPNSIVSISSGNRLAKMNSFVFRLERDPLKSKKPSPLKVLQKWKSGQDVRCITKTSRGLLPPTKKLHYSEGERMRKQANDKLRRYVVKQLCGPWGAVDDVVVEERLCNDEVPWVDVVRMVCVFTVRTDKFSRVVVSE